MRTFARLRVLPIVVLGLSGLAALPAQATRVYSCVDEHGRTHTADRPIAECMNRALRELNRDGSVKRIIPAPLTAEQRKKAELEEEKRKEQQAIRIAQERRDRALVLGYGKEADLESARLRALTGPQDIIKSAKLRIREYEEARQKVLQEMETFRKQKNMPAPLTRRLAEAERVLASEKALILQKEEEIVKLNAKFDEDRARYRDLTSGKVRPGDPPVAQASGATAPAQP